MLKDGKKIRHATLTLIFDLDLELIFLNFRHANAPLGFKFGEKITKIDGTGQKRRFLHVKR